MIDILIILLHFTGIQYGDPMADWYAYGAAFSIITFVVIATAAARDA